MRFTSTRDFARALERALRRAEVPMAYSAGFHPHPRISYANAAPTGVASEAEYVELALARRCDPGDVRVALDAALPLGLDVVEVVEAGPGSLADRLEGSEWRIELRGMTADDVQPAVRRFLAEASVEVTRVLKNGPRTFDVRAAVLELAVVAGQDLGAGAAGAAVVHEGAVGPVEGSCAILRAVVRHTTPSVRPDDILTALRAVTEFSPPVPPLVTRLAQGPLLGAGAGVADPLAADEDAAGP
jgi:radical SAM-linked protein